jgi:hypothetical protein
MQHYCDRHMRRTLALIATVGCLTLQSRAIAEDQNVPTATDVQEKAFVVLQAHKSFADAKAAASLAAAVLSIHYDSRGLSSDARTGLTSSKRDCEQDYGSFPCYVPRGRYDDGVWISVEYSSGYKGFSPGLYLIVVASAPPGDPLIALALARVKDGYPKARIQRAPIYVGCIH